MLVLSMMNLRLATGSATQPNRERWTAHSVVTQAAKLAGRPTGIFFEYGLDDPSIEMNRRLHRKLPGLKFPHGYCERPGPHTCEYCVAALPYHLQFLADRLKPAGHSPDKVP